MFYILLLASVNICARYDALRKRIVHLTL